MLSLLWGKGKVEPFENNDLSNLLLRPPLRLDPLVIQVFKPIVESSGVLIRVDVWLPELLPIDIIDFVFCKTSLLTFL